MPRHKPDVVPQFFMPPRPRFVAFVAAGVPAEAGDHGVGVAAVGVDGDPAPFAGAAPLFHRAGGEGAFDEFTAVEGVADRAGAVVAFVPPAGVAAAPDVGLGADFVGGFDHGLDAGRGAGWRDQFPGRQQLRLRGGRAWVDFGRGKTTGGAAGGSAARGKDGNRHEERPNSYACLELEVVRQQTDLLCRPTGLAVGLPRRDPAPPPELGELAPKTWFPGSRDAKERLGFGISVLQIRGSVDDRP